MKKDYLMPWKYMGLAMAHNTSLPLLKRRPEPYVLTEQEEHVREYGEAINSVMIFPYVFILNLIKETVNPSHPLRAVDLCCGPGHFTRLLSQEFKCEKVYGVDLSAPMLKIASELARKEDLESIEFIQHDVANLKFFEDRSMDVVSFMDAAHHMPSLKNLSEILSEAHRVTKDSGLIVLIDPVRPRTDTIAKLYHSIAGKPYVELGLKYFNQDFLDSIHASWSLDELFSTIPQGTGRKWVQLIPFGFPSFQIIVGLPVDQDEIFLYPGLSTESLNRLIPEKDRDHWFMFNFSLQKMTKRFFQE